MIAALKSIHRIEQLVSTPRMSVALSECEASTRALQRAISTPANNDDERHTDESEQSDQEASDDANEDSDKENTSPNLPMH